jgi:hypothetical protein
VTSPDFGGRPVRAAMCGQPSWQIFIALQKNAAASAC